MPKISSKATVEKTATVLDRAQVQDLARVTDYARVEEWAMVSGYSWIHDHAWLKGHANVTSSVVGGYAKLLNLARVERSRIDGFAVIRDNVGVHERSRITDHVKLSGDLNVYASILTGNVTLTGNLYDRIRVIRVYWWEDVP